MKLNSPLPQPLPKECEKAAKIFKSFVDGGNNGLDGVIPRHVLENAKGFAIFTIFKAGFLFSARAGTGVVIAKLDNGSWSAPSAIGTAGFGIGGQAGAEMTDFLLVLNSHSALKSFMAAGSLTLGGNMSIAIGPLGRNGEALGSLNSSGKVAAMYSYSKTRGLFGGVSIEGSVIVERQDANTQAYDSAVTAKLLLGGSIEPPPWAAPLIRTLEACTGLPGSRKWIQEGGGERGYVFSGMSNLGAEPPGPAQLKKKKKKDDKPSTFPPPSWGKSKDSGSYFTSETEEEANRSTQMGATPWEQDDVTATSNFGTRFESDFSPGQMSRHPRSSLSMSLPQSPPNDLLDTPNPLDFTAYLSPKPSNAPSHSRSISSASAFLSSNSKAKPFAYAPSSNPFIKPFDSDAIPASPSGSQRGHSPTHIRPKPELAKPLLPHEGVARAIALHDFHAVESGDLSFSKGEVITVTQKSDSTYDWWTGKIGSREGIFPANFVEVV